MTKYDNITLRKRAERIYLLEIRTISIIYVLSLETYVSTANFRKLRHQNSLTGNNGVAGFARKKPY